ncbi:PAS domain-containing hybrid sensor histidine kinase/response regulator [Bdellovibrio reynosensis]|uniref:histidine kinase n=1 Tax=Bdellovibrio reynosensis TaxID=2835041 RepID=A0ABY4CCM0_9BACT|nr:PAS domain-containing hybrid sensor histidine kinase/response regulator [Bdellovibrio reynosensis]UOF01273.1 response regulator [Bdellovibrio reynosensis]
MEFDYSVNPFGELARTSFMVQTTLKFDWSQTELGPIENWDIGLINSLRLVFSCPIGMYCTWGPQRRVFYNDAYIPILKHRHPRALGSKLSEVWPEVWDQVDAIASKVEAGGVVREADVQFDIDVDGKPQGNYFTYGNSPLFNAEGKISGMLCTILDTTTSVLRNRAAEESLARSNEIVKAERRKLRMILEKAPIAMAVLDGPEHRFSMVNDLYRGLFLGSTDVSGQRIKDVFPIMEKIGMLADLDDIYRTGKTFEGKNFEVHDRRADGVTYSAFLDFVYQPVYDVNDQIEGIVIAINDVTDRVKAERALQSAKDAAENANHAKSNFLANMSHEIRTPLGAILGFSEMIGTQELESSEREKYLEIVRRNGVSLTRIIDDILDLSKIEAGKFQTELAPVRLKILLQEVVAMYLDHAAEKNIQLKYDLNGIADLSVVTDAVRIRQVLLNLIGNAVKFTSEGLVKISSRAEQVTGARMNVTFRIEDTGIGMTAEQAERLFKPFTQADVTSTRRFGGTGLGLALSKNLAHALGGDVRIVHCEPDKGCIFEFSFEAEDANKLAAPTSTETATVEKQNPFAGFSVLAVDDAPDNRELIKAILKKAGLDVTVVDSGEEALNLAKQKHFDLVLMDIQMPGLDGYGTLSELRKSGFEEPILALTAHAMKEDKAKALAAGFADHLTKPINSKVLLQTIQSYLQH